MSTEELQYVVGEAKTGEPAVIRFFGRVTEETTSRFNDEFDFLENIIRPSCIRVLINSEGGSVLYGMSTYSTIANAKVDTECVIEGVAASMASIIWAAGKRSLMRDYAILMIHNPILPDNDGEEPSDMLLAFTRQIETIYRKRFGLTKEHVRAIMDGQAGKDGTYFDAQAAVKAGIIPSENIIRTSKQLCRKVHDEIAGLADTAAIQELMDRVSEGNKPFEDIFPTLTETEIRNMLAAFLFTGDDVFKLISALSGGERGRVSLAKLMLSEANFLILDEPTNHLDIASKEILEEALNSYTGTVFYVSHDRYFINQTATRILDLTNQAVVNYIGDYDYYLEKKEELTEKYAPAAAQAIAEAKQASDNKLSWQQQKEEQARQRKRENELKKVEARIEELETRDKEIDETMVLPDICTNVAECAKLSKEKAAITEELEGLYEKWEELA